MKQKIQEKFRKLYDGEPLMVKTPGRINLIGEHTDYNEGFVLPASIDKIIYFALQRNNLGICRLYAYDINESFQINLEALRPVDTQWANYLLGVIAQFKKKNLPLMGIDCVFGGDIPIGMGMSSSAAMECGIALGINQLFEFGLEKKELAFMAQRAEHEYAGVKCGIMDQFAILFGKTNQLIKLDCRTLEYELISFDIPEYSIVLCDTGVAHALASTEYNKRRKECYSGVKALQKFDPAIQALRDVTHSFLEDHKSHLDPIVYKRCKYVVDENQRVIDACTASNSNDFTKIGQLMFQSHDGLQDEYEVSCKELDELVEIAASCQGVLGARMMGAGFGGCTINLVRKDSIDKFREAVVKEYYDKHGKFQNIIVTNIKEGTHINDSKIIATIS